MMEWLPRSLFSRMISILLLGLVLAQLLNRSIHLYQHRQTAELSSQIQAAQRIADVIRFVSILRPEHRQTITEQFHDGSLQIQLAKKPLPTNRTGESGDPKFKPLRLALYALLGAEHPPRIIITGPTSQTLLLHIQLKDGDTLIVRLQLPHEIEEIASVSLHLIIIILAITGCSFVAVHWVTRPLQKLADAAELLGKDIHQPPLVEEGPIEVRRAARAFNSMQASLIRHIQDRTRLLAAISHDLKTPITRLRLRTELLDDDQLRGRFQKDLDDMESMVMATLDFMRGVDQQEAFQPLDMMALLESLQADATEMSEKITIHGTMHAPYIGKPTALKRCISNLLDNAFKYGQTAEVFIEDDPDHCVIRVVDQGPGIPDEQMERVFAPYYRLENSRNRDTGGTGLGLSIAQDIAHLHGGHVALLNHAKGGLEAILTLAKMAR